MADGGRLLIVAVWTRPGVSNDDATRAAIDGVREVSARGSGAAVTIKNPNHALRHWLRLVDLAEAADDEPEGGSR
jgi:hypothetical protein